MSLRTSSSDFRSVVGVLDRLHDLLGPGAFGGPVTVRQRLASGRVAVLLLPTECRTNSEITCSTSSRGRRSPLASISVNTPSTARLIGNDGVYEV